MKEKKYPRSEALERVKRLDEPAFLTWGNNQERATALAKTKVDDFHAVQKSNAFLRRDFSNLAPNVSGRPGLTRQDYGFFRPNETVPYEYKRIMMATDYYYFHVGIIRNIIDLMSDFAVQGLRVSHPNKQKERFMRNWFTRVNGLERSERFLNYFYRHGNVVTKIQTAFLSKGDKEAVQKSAAAQINNTRPFQLNKNEIPWKYTFLHPAMVEIVGGPLASFVGNPKYAVQLTEKIKDMILHPRTPAEKEIVAQLPEDIVKAAKSLYPVLLPEGKTIVNHYKKDDWQPWAYPMIYAIMDDIIMLEKLRLADLTALDGAISNLRIFKLSDIENGIAATPNALNYFASILEGHTGGGTIDIVWGGPVELIESKSEVYKFLGNDKYVPHLNAIYGGLGIPTTLTGSGGQGTTNNYMSLKTLIERLD